MGLSGGDGGGGNRTPVRGRTGQSVYKRSLRFGHARRRFAGSEPSAQRGKTSCWIKIARHRRVSRAEAARQAITETADRDRRRAGLAAEAAALGRDPAYVRDAREVARLMEALRGSR